MPRLADDAKRYVILLQVLSAALISAALCIAAIVVPAPAALSPLVALACVGGPIFAGWQAPAALAGRRGRKSIAEFQRILMELPETEHPLGL